METLILARISWCPLSGSGHPKPISNRQVSDISVRSLFASTELICRGEKVEVTRHGTLHVDNPTKRNGTKQRPRRYSHCVQSHPYCNDHLPPLPLTTVVGTWDVGANLDKGIVVVGEVDRDQESVRSSTERLRGPVVVTRVFLGLPRVVV